ncbi:hypothetical protein Glove_302g27 [Diversispora epigaea]|uniref:Uncharacterized protein n=1 Tax=Diversispora epigaea TaxID=1348612 RepID=A0A397HW65_9GLOM|nr:hypothetical protein Glove_302g27 [Diversispora epigaea]
MTFNTENPLKTGLRNLTIFKKIMISGSNYQIQNNLKELVEYISIMKKKDGKEYKANSIKQAIDDIDHYLCIHSPISHIDLHDKYMFQI